MAYALQALTVSASARPLQCKVCCRVKEVPCICHHVLTVRLIAAMLPACLPWHAFIAYRHLRAAHCMMRVLAAESLLL